MSLDDPAAAPTVAPTVAETVAEIAESAKSVPSDPQADLRARMMARFEQWLDETLAGEAPPRGVPEHLLQEATALAEGSQAPAQTDLYTLFSALTTLSGEIRLQGRAFKQLTDLLSPLSETPATLGRMGEALDALVLETDEPEDSPISIDQVCTVMIDLYDRLQRGLQTCDAGIESLTARPRDGWLHRLFGEAASTPAAIASVQAIRDSNVLTLGRLNAAMQQWGMQRIGQAGEAFDPQRMTAVDVQAVDDVPPGTVLAVQRSGYAIHGQVKATAQVSVSKGPPDV